MDLAIYVQTDSTSTAMIAYRIEQPSTKTNIITSDILDVFNIIEKVTDGTPVMITTKELSVAEYENEVKFIATMNLSMQPIPLNG